MCGVVVIAAEDENGGLVGCGGASAMVMVDTRKVL